MNKFLYTFARDATEPEMFIYHTVCFRMDKDNNK